jgi:hypothetical protein
MFYGTGAPHHALLSFRNAKVGLARGQFRPQSPSTQDEAQARPALRKRTSADAVTAFDQQ